MCTDDVRQRPFAYSFDVFLNCSNPRQVKYTYLLLEYTTISIVITPFVLYHTPVRFSLSGSST